MRERPREIPDWEQLAVAFYREQWQFCPVKFGFADYRYFNDHSWIIPIHKKEIITDKGGTAKLWQIEVLKEFVSDTLQKVVKTSEYTPEHDPDRLGAVSPAHSVLWCLCMFFDTCLALSFRIEDFQRGERRYMPQRNRSLQCFAAARRDGSIPRWIQSSRDAPF